ncbi:hypothetical protein FSP39_010195 [Pinctada imbricata]|uniref:Large ribosomal subunit protein bL17m n=1 Tax=Pinctada imbricata TaxID=66713 RepID=A0AA88YTC4_PINIB|nr:hypothetical protein FSP39_010195 [Pinctada imbricata]
MLRFAFKTRPRKLKATFGPASGPEGRIDRLKMLVTALMRYERIETRHDYCDETRGYAERLIQIAIKNGDKCPETMELADYWLLNGRIICMSKRGAVKWIRTLSMPRGICVFGEHLFVADMKEDNIQVFTLHGDFMKTILSHDDEIRRPQVVTINNTGDKLLVAMAPPYHNDCIKIFDLKYQKKDAVHKTEKQNQKGTSCFVS